MAIIPYTYISQGNYTAALNWVMTDYIGFGLLYLVVGLVIFTLVYSKSQSFAISGFVFIFYSWLISTVLPSEIAKYLYLLIAFLLAVIIAKIYFGK